MKVAFTSSTGEIIDQHFGMSDSFHVWEIGPDEAHFLETVRVGSHGDDEEDKIGARPMCFWTVPSSIPCRSAGPQRPSWWRER